MLDVSLLKDVTRDELATGTLSVLNCGSGDLKFSFDPAKPMEAEKAKGVIEDMLKRGYVLLVEVDGVWCRAVGFDPGRCEYIIPPDLPVAEMKAAREELVDPQPTGRRGRPKGVPAEGVRATAVAATAGG